MNTKHHFLHTLLAASAIGLFAPAVAHAHGGWIAKLHGQQTVMYGHEESDSDPYDPARIVDARAMKNGQTEPVKVVGHEGRYATLEADKPGVLGYAMDNGFWYKTKEGKWFNKPKSDASNAADVESSVRSLKYSVSYLNNREPARALGYELEIVPASNPAKLKKGEKLAVQVLYKGKPVQGVDVSNNFFGEHQKATTNAEGRVELPVARNGMNTLAVSHTAPFDDKTKADEYSIFSTLSFKVKGEDAQH